MPKNNEHVIIRVRLIPITGRISSQGLSFRCCVFKIQTFNPPCVNQIWCLGSSTEPENQINRTVDGAVLSILLTGLLPGVRYAVVVTAVTGLGVGAQSPPVSLLLSESLKPLQPLQIDG